MGLHVCYYHSGALPANSHRHRNHKPTESDMEDDSEGDSDSDNDPATWFEDDQDDGRKGQDIIEPDSDYPEDDLSDLIRVDESRIPYNLNFYSNEGD